MKHKALRILIADEHPGQLLWIERLLNRFDYYRIAPIRTFGELVQLTSNPDDRFDWLIVNQALVRAHGADVADFCRRRPHIAHTLVYETLPTVCDLLFECPLPIGGWTVEQDKQRVGDATEKNNDDG